MVFSIKYLSNNDIPNSMDILNRIGHSLRATEQIDSIVLAKEDRLEAIVVKTERTQYPDYGNMAVGTSEAQRWIFPVILYEVQFHGNGKTLSFYNEELYQKLQQGQNVTLGLKPTIELKKDFKPPYFSMKVIKDHKEGKPILDYVEVDGKKVWERKD